MTQYERTREGAAIIPTRCGSPSCHEDTHRLTPETWRSRHPTGHACCRVRTTEKHPGERARIEHTSAVGGHVLYQPASRRSSFSGYNASTTSFKLTYHSERVSSAHLGVLRLGCVRYPRLLWEHCLIEPSRCQLSHVGRLDESKRNRGTFVGPRHDMRKPMLRLRSSAASSRPFCVGM